MSAVKLEHKSKTARILELLKSKGEATNHELNRICFRYAARLYELRQEGHVIVSVQMRRGLWRYVYKGEREVV